MRKLFCDHDHARWHLGENWVLGKVGAPLGEMGRVVVTKYIIGIINLFIGRSGGWVCSSVAGRLVPRGRTG